MSETRKHHKPERKDFAFGISLPEFLVSVALGVSSGLVTAANKARDLFHDDIREATAFKKHFESRKARLDMIERKNFGPASDYWKAIVDEKGKLNDELNDLAFKFRGVRSGPVMGTIDRFRTLSPRSKSNLYFTGAVGAAVGAALTLGFFNGVATRDKIDKIADAVNADKER